MISTIDSLFGVHEKGLIFRSKRAEVLASNMANADTPGYKARDFDFKSVLNQLDGSQTSLRRTNANHVGFDKSPATINLSYRIPNSASLDGNTVDVNAEQARYDQNALDQSAHNAHNAHNARDLCLYACTRFGPHVDLGPHFLDL